jgi:hypothetical protein
VELRQIHPTRADVSHTPRFAFQYSERHGTAVVGVMLWANWLCPMAGSTENFTIERMAWPMIFTSNASKPKEEYIRR